MRANNQYCRATSSITDSRSAPSSRHCSALAAVDPGFRDGPNAFQVHAAGGFQLGTAGGEGDGFAHLVQAHVVQEDHGGPVLQGLAQLGEVFHFHLDEYVGGGDGAGGGQGGGNAAGRDDVVLLDQHTVIETDTVVDAATDGHRVFLSQAKTRQGLAGIHDMCAGAGHGVHKAARHRGRAGKELEEVEGRPLGGQQGPGTGHHVAQGLTGLDQVPILDVPQHRGGGVQGLEGGVEPGGPAYDSEFAGDDPAAGIGFGGDEAGGQVAGAHVLRQGGGHGTQDFDAELFGLDHGGASNEGGAHSTQQAPRRLSGVRPGG